MLTKVDANVFKREIPQELFLSVDFVAITAEIIDANPVYYIFYNKVKANIAFALFVKGNKVIMPKFYSFYSGIWLNGSLNDAALRKDFYSSIKVITNLYSSIELLLPPSINDVRAFISNDFSIKVKYTYIKNTADFNFKKDVKKNLRRSERDLELLFYTEKLTTVEWNKHYNQFELIGSTNENLQKLENWIITLELMGNVKTFYLKNKLDEILGSGIIILDEYNKTAGFLLSYVPKGYYQSAINVSLYVNIQRWLKENGYSSFNYLGANILPIAEFKSRFEPELVSYFYVNYDKYVSLLRKAIVIFKNMLKRIFRF